VRVPACMECYGGGGQGQGGMRLVDLTRPAGNQQALSMRNEHSYNMETC